MPQGPEPNTLLIPLSRLTGLTLALPSLLINIQSVNCAILGYSHNKLLQFRILFFLFIGIVCDILMGVLTAGWVLNRQWEYSAPCALVFHALKRIYSINTFNLTLMRYQSCFTLLFTVIFNILE
jgi:uncharacterized membrane protein YfcA